MIEFFCLEPRKTPNTKEMLISEFELKEKTVGGECSYHYVNPAHLALRNICYE